MKLDLTVSLKHLTTNDYWLARPPQVPLHSPARFRVEVWFSPGAARGALEERAAAFMATAPHEGVGAADVTTGGVGAVGAGEELPAAGGKSAGGGGRDGDGGGSGSPGTCTPPDALEAERHAVTLAPLACLNAGPDAGGRGCMHQWCRDGGCGMGCVVGTRLVAFPPTLRCVHLHLLPGAAF